MFYGPTTPYAYIRDNPAAMSILLSHVPSVVDEPDAFLQPYTLVGELVARGKPIGEDMPDLSPLWAELSAVPFPSVTATSRPVPPDLIDSPVPHAEAPTAKCERWGLAELTFKGPDAGNPFVDVTLEAVFALADRSIRVGGFYDGDGVYRIRFLPPEEGQWMYQTSSNATALNGILGSISVGPASPANHGRVVVRDDYHFAYDDGSPYLPFGTTAYAWTHQSEAQQERTLDTLAGTTFTKLRMCLFPKSFLYNTQDPSLYPFERNDDGTWDFARPSLAYFRLLERRILDLQRVGVEADLILFHPYDRWGFCDMPAWVDRFYTQYVVRRLAAYRNVWWSLANEYDFVKTKTIEDWEGIAHVITDEDHASHLVGIHNGAVLFDNNASWVTHSSIQKNDSNHTSASVDAWRTMFKKPVVVDEIGYEGDLGMGWGNLSAQEMVRRAWDGAVGGAYVNHGECFSQDEEDLWWSHGGQLRGESADRFAFLTQMVQACPSRRFEPLVSDFDLPWGGNRDYRVAYFGLARPKSRAFTLPPGTWDVDIIDTWAMTCAPLPEPVQGRVEIGLPGREYIAVRFRSHE